MTTISSTPALILDVIQNALTVVRSLVKDYDPLFRHTPETARKGDSEFLPNFAHIAHILDAIGSDPIKTIPGDNGAIVFVVQHPTEVGTAVEAVPLDEEPYTLRMLHGCLQPIGPATFEGTAVTYFSCVLTPEDTADGKQFALASVFPGLPGNPDYVGFQKYIEEELKLPFAEGTVVLGAVLKKYNIRPRTL